MKLGVDKTGDILGSVLPLHAFAAPTIAALGSNHRPPYTSKTTPKIHIQNHEEKFFYDCTPEIPCRFTLVLCFVKMKRLFKSTSNHL
ncbi:hypothetical protein J6590_104154 [Homalodisca vitripennis]|nr:hypothetical protein J6590_104154 [Homalodisca vitripennis]